jgi:hypothetical protein
MQVQTKVKTLERNSEQQPQLVADFEAERIMTSEYQLVCKSMWMTGLICTLGPSGPTSMHVLKGRSWPNKGTSQEVGGLTSKD